MSHKMTVIRPVYVQNNPSASKMQLKIIFFDEGDILRRMWLSKLRPLKLAFDYQRRSEKFRNISLVIKNIRSRMTSE
jgi:hypothetical protein